MSNLHAQMNPNATTLVTTAETAAATSAPFNVADPSGQGVHIGGMVNLTTGTGTTGVQIRVRQGVGTGGAQVGPTLPVTIGAAVSDSIPYDVVDPTLSAQADVYTVTVQQVGASGNGTVNCATITTETATYAD